MQTDAPRPASRREVRGLQASVLFLGAGFPIVTGFSVGNVGQAISLFLLLPAMRRLSQKDVLTLVVVVLGICVSPLLLTARGTGSPNWLQIAFFCLAALHVALAIRLAPHVDARSALRTPINLAAIFLAGTATFQYVTEPIPYYDFYYQDKSHAAVTAYGLAFLVMWANNGVSRFALAGAVYAASLLTASRLVALGAPLFLLAALLEYRRTRRLAMDPGRIYLHHLVLWSLPVVLVYVARSAISKTLGARLQSFQDDSLAAHIELIRLAFELKLADVGILFFGVGPGGFASGLRDQGISLFFLGSRDPGAIQALRGDFAPIHSANASVLVEFPLWVALAFMVLWLGVLRRLWRQREWNILLMCLGLLLVTTFYSSHNEFFYWAFLSVACLAAYHVPVEPKDRKSKDRPPVGTGSDQPRPRQQASLRSR
ncbi:hypothetical protein [Nocardioides sp. zg-1228]|uniref:hypothetical protein n=1 Tax=Nocardioides sp. zg-1228 TaxID=2763008 RepID=UPI001642547E|nr:hypothetical protein [Nocardioides sp. zg-1228]MBC2931650.1 hypothetical protein [Nocardioides sp. zg-1228]QSF57241.1 hypothetical protein JX575_17030 [Nocardioides sp. zg-1228]